jgi:hypothetical protein
MMPELTEVLGQFGQDKFKSRTAHLARSARQGFPSYMKGVPPDYL